MKLRTLLIAIFFTIIANVSYGQVSIITKPFTKILKKVSNKVSNKLSKNSIQYLAEHGPKNYISKEISLVSRTNKMISVDFSDKIISRNYLVFKFFTKDVDKIGTKYIIKGIKNIERENLEYILKKGYSKFYIKEIRRLRIKNKFFLDAGIDNISKKMNRINILKFNKFHQVKELGAESAEKVVKNTLGDDVSKYTLKTFDDDLVKRLAKDIVENKGLKDLLSSNKSAIKIWKLVNNTPVKNNVHVLKYFSNIIDDIGEQKFKNKYIFEELGDKVILKGRNNNVLAEIGENALSAKSGNDKILNEFLCEYKMIPNMKYKVNGQSYITDVSGRYKEISGTLTHLPQTIPVRNKIQQGLSKKVKGGIPVIRNGKILRVKQGYPVYKDEGGHLIANQFGGGSEMYNYVPMSKKLNGSGGGWYRMERKWSKALKEGKKVNYKIEPIYKGETQRPDMFSVTYEVDGERFNQLFDNNIF